MNPQLGKRVLTVLIVAMVLVAIRTGYIFYERTHEAGQPEAAVAPVNGYRPTTDDYISSPKVFPYDVKSAAKEMVGKTVWVRQGNAIPYYRYNQESRAADLAHTAGVLPPLEKLQVKDVIQQRAPVVLAPGQVAIAHQEVLAVVEAPGQAGAVAVAIGTNTNEDFQFTANENFFFADPHELYKHWPADVWTAIDQHQVRKGMSELQVSFALGAVSGATRGEYGNRMAQYRSGGELFNVTFENNRAVKILEEKN